MTRHLVVNKCRRQEKCKMAALIRQASLTSGYEMVNKPKIKKKKRMVKKNGKRETKQQHFLKRNRRQEMSASNVTKAGYM